jgi:hypothetical protein
MKANANLKIRPRRPVRGALLRAGAKIRAHPLDDFKPHHPDDDKPKVIEPIDPRRPSKRAVIA